MAEKEFGSGKLLVFGLVAIIVATVGTSFLTSYLLGDGGEKAATAEAKPEKLETMDVGEFTVNLADKSKLHFLRTSVSIAIAPDKTEAWKADEPQIRDEIIQVLRSKSKEDLQKPQSLESLRKELLSKINNIAGQGHVFAIYFTDFVIQ